MRRIVFAFFALCNALNGMATTWTTATAGNVNTLSNWTNGTSAPTSFATPGDKWVINKAMVLPASATWIVGTASSTADTVVFATGGQISMTGAGSSFTMTIYGQLQMNGGSFTLGGAGTSALANIYGDVITTTGVSYITNGASSVMTVDVNGDYTMGGDTVKTGGASGAITMNIHGKYTATSGLINTNGAGCTTLWNVFGNYSVSGPFAMTNTGAGCDVSVHLKLNRSAGTMLADNTSTGTWSGTDIYVDTNCIAQLDGNFKAPTGSSSTSSAGSLIVDGTLVCPAAYVVNGGGLFTLNGVATLKVAHATGINGAITSSGTRIFRASANYEFNGTAAQVTGSYLPAVLVAPDTITINNPAGVTLSQTTSTTGKLAFAAGVLATGAFTMTTPGAASAVYGAGPSNYVNGMLIKTITGLTSVNYEIGDTDYVPMLLTFTTPATAGTIGMKSTLGLHPVVATSGLLPADMVNHYWTLTTAGAAGTGAVMGLATYNFVDILGGTNAGFKMQHYNGSAWLGAAVTTTNTAAPYTSGTPTGGALASLAGDYIFGNVDCGTAPIASPAATVCVGANLTLTDANPGGSWTSATPSVGSVSSAGVVTGVSVGLVVISYTASGCTVNTLLSVNPMPSAGTVTAADTFVCVGRTLALSDTAAGGTWSVSNTALGSMSGAILTGIAAGIDTVIYTITNSCGTDTARKRIKVVSAAACHSYIAGIENVVTELKVFPNPNGGSFTVNLVSERNEPAHMVVVNVLGKVIKEFSAPTNHPADIRLAVPPGIYLLSAYSGGERYTARIMIE